MREQFRSLPEPSQVLVCIVLGAIILGVAALIHYLVTMFKE